MKLRLDAGGQSLADINLGELSDRHGYLDEGDLAHTGGNLYLYVDGVEWGSLFFHAPEGNLTITLGQYDSKTGDWRKRAALVRPVRHEYVWSECDCGEWHVTDDRDDPELIETFATEDEAREHAEQLNREERP
jgi:hypothetical protein